MSRRKRFSLLTRGRHALEFLALRSLFLAIRFVPLDAASALGGWLGGTFGRLLPRTKVARTNLRLAFPEKSPREIEAIIRGMWRNLGRTACEYPHLDRFKPCSVGDRVEIVGAENLKAIGKGGQSAFMFSGHLANWELLGPAAAARGIHLNMFYRQPSNPLLAWLYEIRRSGKGEMLPKGRKGARRAMSLLRRGAPFAMLVDQKMNDGIPVDFFGRKAMTAPALAELALRLDCPVLPTRIRRLKGARFRITILPPLRFARGRGRQADILAAMTQVNALLETWIRACPEQWLWLHRRWPAESGS